MRKPFTATEMRKFRKLKKDYIQEGYPEYQAEARAWDIIWLEHNIRMGVKPRKLQEA